MVNLDIKLAYWMGIREMYVIGVDFSFKVPQTPTGEVVYGNKVIVSEGECNHFHPDYRTSGEAWTVPKLDEQEEEFAAARKFLEEREGNIYNASRKTKLDVWERVDFEDLLSISAETGHRTETAHSAKHRHHAAATSRRPAGRER